MSRLTYKILVHPETFKPFLREITVYTAEECMPMEKRDVPNEEVEAKWTREEFLVTLTECGYGGAAEYFIEEWDLYNDKN